MTRANVFRLLPILLIVLALTGCQVVGGIFKAGVWVGVIAVVLVLVLVLWIAGKARK